MPASFTFEGRLGQGPDAGRLEGQGGAGQPVGHLVRALPQGKCRNSQNCSRSSGADSFVVVAVSVDRKGVEASAEFLKSVGADALKLYIDKTGRSLGALKSPGLPTTILIDGRAARSAACSAGDWIAPEAV